MNENANGELFGMSEEVLKTEVRHLGQEIKHQIAEILENDNNFERFMLALPNHLEDIASVRFNKRNFYERKYGSEQLKQIEFASDFKTEQRLKGEILLDEWGSSGHQRPRIVHLIYCLDKVRLHSPSSILKKYINPSGVSAEESKKVTIKVLMDLNNGCLTEDTSFETLPIKKFNFDDIKATTNNFNTKIYEGFQSPGRFIGSGGSSCSYIAIDLMDEVKFVAVKMMKKIDEQRSTKEDFIYQLSNGWELKHDNIVKLLGYSNDVKACLIYEYSAGGSLKRRLEKVRVGEVLYDFKDRVQNLREVSSALVHLHNDKKLVHRNVRPAKILIDGRVAKLGGLNEVMPPSCLRETRNFRFNWYKAPELVFGKHETYSSDVFAFGLVMMETLTGLKLVDEERLDHNYLVRKIKI